MAITNNVLLREARGTFGKQFVFRQRNGKTVICKMPKPYEKPPTNKQLANRERFAKANEFAKSAIADPVKKQYYLGMAKPGQSAYNVAFREAFHGPEIISATVEAEVIIVRVKDNYITSTVKVNNKPAVFNAKRKAWECAIRPKGKFVVQAYDRYGHVATKEIISPT